MKDGDVVLVLLPEQVPQLVEYLQGLKANSQLVLTGIRYSDDNLLPDDDEARIVIRVSPNN